MQEEKNLNSRKSKNNSRPVGIFDSGFGGLTVMSAIAKIMPSESLVYFGDTAHVPYGSKSKDVVTGFSLKISDFLAKQNVKAIVVACNTASAFSLDSLIKSVKIPVIGVIKAGAAAAVKNTLNKKIGIIGTEGTVKSGAYVKEIKKFDKTVKCYPKACPLFVPLVEEGWLTGHITEETAKIYLKDIIKKDIDTLILGCTHYPHLKNTIKKIAGKKIKIIDSATAVAYELKKLLEEKHLSNNKGKPKYSFYVSDSPVKFKSIGSRFFTKKINKVLKVEI